MTLRDVTDEIPAILACLGIGTFFAFVLILIGFTFFADHSVTSYTLDSSTTNATVIVVEVDANAVTSLKPGVRTFVTYQIVGNRPYWSNSKMDLPVGITAEEATRICLTMNQSLQKPVEAPLK
jgi:hypothetical protein